MDNNHGNENPTNTQNVDNSATLDTASDEFLALSGEEQAEKLLEERKGMLDTNKSLFARTKKAETDNKALKELSGTKEETSEVKTEVTESKDIDIKTADIKKLLEEALEERELDSMDDVSAELKNKLKVYAKTEGITVREAKKSDYCTFLQEKEKAANVVEDASIGNKHKATSKKEFNLVTPPKFDMTTEDGRKEYSEYKSWRNSQGK